MLLYQEIYSSVTKDYSYWAAYCDNVFLFKTMYNEGNIFRQH